MLSWKTETQLMHTQELVFQQKNIEAHTAQWQKRGITESEKEESEREREEQKWFFLGLLFTNEGQPGLTSADEYRETQE